LSTSTVTDAVPEQGVDPSRLNRRLRILLAIIIIADVLDRPHDEANIAAVRAKVATLTRDFPVYR